MIYTTIPAVLVMMMAHFVTTSILALFITFIVSQLVLAILLYYGALWYIPPNQNFDDDASRFGTHLSFMNVLGNLTYQLDRFLAWHFVGPIALAVYSVATAPPQQLRYFNKIIATIALPRFSKRSVTSLKQTMGRKLIVSFVFGLLLVIPYWFAAPYLFALFFPKYLDAVIYSQVFSLVMLFFPAALLQESLKAHAQTNILYVLNVGIPILKIILLFLLIPIYGLWGIFIALFVLETTRLLLALHAFYALPPKHATLAHDTTTHQAETETSL
jgi:O-antigen/teichoic acid export membrane protein